MERNPLLRAKAPAADAAEPLLSGTKTASAAAPAAADAAADAACNTVLSTLFALGMAVSMVSAAVAVKLTTCSVLWIMAARCVGDLVLSTVSIALVRAYAPGGHDEKLALFFGCSPGLVVRGVAYYVFLMCWYLSVDMMPVGDAVALAYSSPALIVPLCWLALGEPVPAHFPLLFLFCFGGVVLVAQPAGWFGGAATESLSLAGVGFAVASVLAIAGVTVITRRYRRAHVLHVQQASGATALVLVPLSFAVAACTATGAPPPPATSEWPAIAAVALFAFCGMACWKLAHEFAPTPAEVQLIFVLEVPLGIFAQAVIFDDHLDLLDWLGCGLILLSSLIDKACGAGCFKHCFGPPAPPPAPPPADVKPESGVGHWLRPMANSGLGTSRTASIHTV